MGDIKIKVEQWLYDKYVADGILDCIPESNWTELKDELVSDICGLIEHGANFVFISPAHPNTPHPKGEVE